MSIGFNQIIRGKRSNSNESDQISLQFKDYYRSIYSPRNQNLEDPEISSYLLGHEDSPQLKEKKKNDLKIKGFSSEGKGALILKEEKKESAANLRQRKPAPISKKGNLNNKYSNQTKERIQKKIQKSRDTTIDFFNDVFQFGNQKEKKKELVKQQQQYKDKNKDSLEQTNIQTLSNPNASFDLQISQALVNVFNYSLNRESKKQNSKVKIEGGSQIFINIIPPKQFLAVQEPQVEIPKPEVKLCHGQIEVSVDSKKQICPINVPYHLTQQRRLPIFLLNFRKMTNRFPNFYSINVFNQEGCKKINLQFIRIAEECKKAIGTLKESYFKLHELFTSIRQLFQLMSYNILNEKSEQDQTLLSYFLRKDWGSYLQTEELQLIRPRDYFVNRSFNELNFIKQLNKYQEIIDRLQNKIVVNHEIVETQPIYMEGRQKLWRIQMDLRVLSESLYLHSISHFSLPSHLVGSHKFLTALKQNQELVFDQEKDILLNNLLILQDQQDIFGSSWLGTYTIKCLCNLKK